MSSLKTDFLLGACAGLVAMASCSLFAADAADAASNIAQQVAGQPTSNDPVTVGGVDLIEVLILALAALGLGPVARILGLLRPVLRPILRAILGARADSPASSPPSGPPKAPES